MAPEPPRAHGVLSRHWDSQGGPTRGPQHLLSAVPQSRDPGAGGRAGQGGAPAPGSRLTQHAMAARLPEAQSPRSRGLIGGLPRLGTEAGELSGRSREEKRERQSLTTVFSLWPFHTQLQGGHPGSEGGTGTACPRPRRRPPQQTPGTPTPPSSLSWKEPRPASRAAT